MSVKILEFIAKNNVNRSTTFRRLRHTRTRIEFEADTGRNSQLKAVEFHSGSPSLLANTPTRDEKEPYRGRLRTGYRPCARAVQYVVFLTPHSPPSPTPEPLFELVDWLKTMSVQFHVPARRSSSSNVLR